MIEGGATFAEDTVADLMNRYLDEAGDNFNGIGLLANPNQSLFSRAARYKSSLFWRYLAEQRSRLVEEPTIGVDAYRRVIEECSANGYTTDSVKRAIRSLPFDSELCTFGYDAGMADTPASTETTFGNFALACYLKDLAARPDARFGFLENAENIHIDDVVRLVIPDAPSTETLVKVRREPGRVTRDGAKVVFQSSVAALANRFFEIEVASDVATVDLDVFGRRGFFRSPATRRDRGERASPRHRPHRQARLPSPPRQSARWPKGVHPGGDRLGRRRWRQLPGFGAIRRGCCRRHDHAVELGGRQGIPRRPARFLLDLGFSGPLVRAGRWRRLCGQGPTA